MNRPTTLTAATYHAKYLEGGNANTNRLFRWLRMLCKEAKEHENESDTNQK